VLASVEGSDILQQVTLASGAEYRAFSAPRQVCNGQRWCHGPWSEMWPQVVVAGTPVAPVSPQEPILGTDLWHPPVAPTRGTHPCILLYISIHQDACFVAITGSIAGTPNHLGALCFCFCFCCCCCCSGL
jgi:hypothetical protein